MSLTNGGSGVQVNGKVGEQQTQEGRLDSANGIHFQRNRQQLANDDCHVHNGVCKSSADRMDFAVLKTNDNFDRKYYVNKIVLVSNIGRLSLNDIQTDYNFLMYRPFTLSTLYPIQLF